MLFLFIGLGCFEATLECIDSWSLLKKNGPFEASLLEWSSLSGFFGAGLLERGFWTGDFRAGIFLPRKGFLKNFSQ